MNNKSIYYIYFKSFLFQTDTSCIRLLKATSGSPDHDFSTGPSEVDACCAERLGSSGMQRPGCRGRAFLPAWRLFWALSPARLFFPGLLVPPFYPALPTGAWRGRMAPSLPRRLGSTSQFLSKGYLCKRCLVPSSPQPRRRGPSLLNGASAEPRSSDARRFGGDLAPRCRRGSSGAPGSARTPQGRSSLPPFVTPGHRGDDPSPLPHLEALCSAAFSLEAWKYGYTRKRLPCDAPSASCRGFSLSGHPGASSTGLVLRYGNLRGKGIVFFHGKPSSHRDVLGNKCPDSLSPPAVTMNCVHRELREAPALPAKGFQSCTPRPRPRLCTPPPPCPSVSPSCPHGTPRTPRAFARPGLDVQGIGGGPGACHIPPRQCHCIPPAQGPLSPMQVPPPPLPCPLPCPRCPGLGEAGGEGCPVGPSPCPHGTFGGCSDNFPPDPHGCSTHGCLAAPRGSAVFGGGLSPYAPQLLPPLPLNWPQEVTGTPGQALLK